MNRAVILAALSLALVQFAAACQSDSNSAKSPACNFCTDNKLECPKYKVLEKKKEYELRRYLTTHWVASHTIGKDSEISKRNLFKRVKRYTDGANEKAKKVAKTAPVMVKVKQTASGTHNLTVAFHMTSNNPPMPTEDKVFLMTMHKQRMYVRSFEGLADDKKFAELADELRGAINDDSKYNPDPYFTAVYKAGSHVLSEIMFPAVPHKTK